MTNTLEQFNTIREHTIVVIFQQNLSRIYIVTTRFKQVLQSLSGINTEQSEMIIFESLLIPFEVPSG